MADNTVDIYNMTDEEYEAYLAKQRKERKARIDARNAEIKKKQETDDEALRAEQDKINTFGTKTETSLSEGVNDDGKQKIFVKKNIVDDKYKQPINKTKINTSIAEAQDKTADAIMSVNEELPADTVRLGARGKLAVVKDDSTPTGVSTRHIVEPKKSLSDEDRAWAEKYGSQYEWDENTRSFYKIDTVQRPGKGYDEDGNRKMEWVNIGISTRLPPSKANALFEKIASRKYDNIIRKYNIAKKGREEALAEVAKLGGIDKLPEELRKKLTINPKLKEAADKAKELIESYSTYDPLVPVDSTYLVDDEAWTNLQTKGIHDRIYEKYKKQLENQDVGNKLRSDLDMLADISLDKGPVPIEDAIEFVGFPYSKGAIIRADWSIPSQKQGVIPISIESNGQQKQVMVPFNKLNKLKKILRSWSDGEEVPYVVMHDNANKADEFTQAWHSGDYNNTTYPRYASGISDDELKNKAAYGYDELKPLHHLYNLNSTYHTDPEAFMAEHAEYVAMAHRLGISLSDLFDMLAENTHAEGRALYENYKDAIMTGGEDEIREAELAWLDWNSKHGKYGISREKSYNILDAHSKGDFAGLEDYTNKTKADIRADIRTDKQRELESRIADDMKTINRQFSILSGLDSKIKAMSFNIKDAENALPSVGPIERAKLESKITSLKEQRQSFKDQFDRLGGQELLDNITQFANKSGKDIFGKYVGMSENNSIVRIPMTRVRAYHDDDGNVMVNPDGYVVNMDNELVLDENDNPVLLDDLYFKDDQGNVIEKYIKHTDLNTDTYDQILKDLGIATKPRKGGGKGGWDRYRMFFTDGKFDQGKWKKHLESKSEKARAQVRAARAADIAEVINENLKGKSADAIKEAMSWSIREGGKDSILDNNIETSKKVSVSKAYARMVADMSRKLEGKVNNPKRFINTVIPRAKYEKLAKTTEQRNKAAYLLLIHEVGKVK